MTVTSNTLVQTAIPSRGHSADPAAAISGSIGRIRRLATKSPAIIFAVLFGGLLIGLSLPRVGAGLAVSRHVGVIEQLAQGGSVTSAELAVAASGYRRALRVLETGQRWVTLGAINIERARRAAGDPQAYGVLLDRGIMALRRGLAIAPAQPFGWTMLAQAMLARHGPVSAVGPALKMAIRTALRNRQLLLPRIEVSLAVWPHLDSETRALVREQVALAVDLAPVGLARLARIRYVLGLVRRLLAADPTRLRRFDTVYLGISATPVGQPAAATTAQTRPPISPRR